ncbi:MAG TPA: glutamate synthase large subunit [Longimicrobiaceae bacterium]|nr:glutamate synthase large subunit [Longimicrobiaceae bacterium]
MSERNRLDGMPVQQGLYDPRHEHDACGVGFVAHAKGCRSHSLVRQALSLLDNLSHRGAAGCDPESGDGAGILLQIPDALLRGACGALGIALPPAGEYGVGMLFLPGDAAARTECEAHVAAAAAAEGCELLGWRDVPVDPARLGREARRTLPYIRQCFVARTSAGEESFERTLYRVRKRAEGEIARAGIGSFYAASFSSRTIVYKGLLTPDQMPAFFLDLANPELESAIALVHSRFSTNTFPTWARAHPYRMVCHNGEINALRGNVNWMRVREGALGEEAQALRPIVAEDQSDSACLDNALEFLVMGGRSLPHSAMMLLPEAWEGEPSMDPAVRDFFAYHSTIMEPWDGPAAVAFTDGRTVGAVLDRNGLRPARWAVTWDDLVVLASEAGALPLPAAAVRAKGRLGPGRMLLVDTEAGRILDDAEIKQAVASARPYGKWVEQERLRLEDLPAASPEVESTAPMLERQAAFGYTVEELRFILTPMATSGQEPIGSMGTDTPLAVLSDEPQLLFKYFRQLFAQVTNPPIDPIREQLVMSLAAKLGPRADLLSDGPAHARRLWLERPVLSNAELSRIRAMRGPFRARTLSTLFPVEGGPKAMAVALEALCRAAAAAVRKGCGILILSDRGIDEGHAAIPSLLAVAAVHHHLIRAGLRSHTSLVSDTGEAHDVTHFALLLGYGAEAVCPHMAWETLTAMAREGDLGGDAAAAKKHFIKAVDKGLLKILSKMGISTLQSYCGAQIFEAIGLGPEVVERYFTGTASRIGGIGILQLAEETLRRHRAAFDTALPRERLDPGGEYHYRIQSEHHNWSPMAIAKLQHSTRTGDAKTFKEFSRIVNEEQARFNLRGHLEPIAADQPIPLEEVEPASEIVRRFCTGAMSFGSISREAHETLALAMNRLGGRSNTGEGGEEADRFRDGRNSAIKQVASGRFGVTTEYLINARELQIKIAQGAKPGEGGQLPGHKVDAVIAKTRHSTPGVTLISPPPHHDIYSIEDLAQLIHDLKTVNPQAMVSVKLVSEVGVGTVAAGVAKAKADLIVIAGDNGGTGASPVSSIKNAGIPWELGLAETQQTLVLNDLRGRVVLQTDGQLRTGRDVVIAALLGAEEYGFATAPLIVEGCIMMRKCHLNTCPVGIATQDPVLRKKFTGQPEHVINYFFFVAEEVREWMAKLGFRSVAEMVGRSDRLRQRPAEHWKASSLDLSSILHRPEAAQSVAIRRVQEQDHGLETSLDHELIRLARPALERGGRISAELPITNTHRAVGAMLSGEIARRYGAEGLPDGAIRVRFTGAAGQSFGAFAAAGLSLTLEGEANDYVGKGLSGGRLVIFPPRDAGFVAEDTVIVGNTVLYGATGGEAFFRGQAGERFAVRNSGATAVVEGVGDHGCEYMTGGTVVVLGPTGRNFGAGMSGGTAYVLPGDSAFEPGASGLLELETIEDPVEAERLRRLIERHAAYTASTRARRILENWEEVLPQFIKVIPVEYKRALQTIPHLAKEEALAHG